MKDAASFVFERMLVSQAEGIMRQRRKEKEESLK